MSPLVHFYCPDAQRITVKQCLTPKGCRMSSRCCPLPFLRKIGYDRKYHGVSPSAAGNGPRLIWGKAAFDYCADPNDRVFAVLGTTIHGRMSDLGITHNVLSEEVLKDKDTKGIADLLEEDEFIPGHYILTDYKTSGSFAVAKWMGINIKKTDIPVLDEKGEKVYLRSGKNKGKVKTKQDKTIEYINPEKELFGVSLQVNRYRIFYEQYGFPISKMRIFAIPRDGGTWIAIGRGIVLNKYFIDIPRMNDDEVLGFYKKLQAEVNQAFDEEYARLCAPWECWEGNRCANYCEIKEDCKDICREFDEKWPGTGKERK